MRDLTENDIYEFMHGPDVESKDWYGYCWCVLSPDRNRTRMKSTCTRILKTHTNRSRVFSALYTAILYLSITFARYVIPMLINSECPNSKSRKSELVFIRTCYSEILSLTVVPIIFGTSFGATSTKTPRSDFSVTWYEDVGSYVVNSLVLIPALDFVVEVLLLLLRLTRRRWFAQKYRIQIDLNRVYENPSFAVEYRYSRMLSYSLACVIFSAGMPILLPLGALTMAVYFFYERALFLWLTKREEYTHSLSLERPANYLMLFGCGIHCCFAVGMYGDLLIGCPKIFRTDYLDTLIDRIRESQYPFTYRQDIRVSAFDSITLTKIGAWLTSSTTVTQVFVIVLLLLFTITRRIINKVPNWRYTCGVPVKHNKEFEDLQRKYETNSDSATFNIHCHPEIGHIFSAVSSLSAQCKQSRLGEDIPESDVFDDENKESWNREAEVYFCEGEKFLSDLL
eukprot:GHVO01051097.1.p1 GENE.GHVO01051097.1~~GHVO01051097.1.p1  ORF type:complete len:525 (+),score=54.07 GHVO01051097.1:219-1577(+)